MLKNAKDEMIISPQGDFTIYRVEELKKEISAGIQDAKTVFVDMGDVGKIDTAAFQLVVSLKKTCEANKKTISFINIPESVKNFSQLFGCEEIFVKGDE